MTSHRSSRLVNSRSYWRIWVRPPASVASTSTETASPSSVFTEPEAASSTVAAAGDAWRARLNVSADDEPTLAALGAPKPITALVLFVVMRVIGLIAQILFRCRTSGRENLPAAGPLLLCPNHQSYLDGFLIVAALPFRIFRNLCVLGHSKYFSTPLMRWVARTTNIVPVNPNMNLVYAMQAGAHALRQGKVLLLFPEGERTIDGSIKEFRKGAAILSAHLGVPVVPMALDGTYDVWPRARRPQKLATVQIRFGRQIPPPEPPPLTATPAECEDSYAAATERLRGDVLDLWRSISGSDNRA